jgi:hypothetical protein
MSGEMSKAEEPGQKNRERPRNHRIHIGSWTLPLPMSPILRMIIGIVLILAGLVGFLPVLGFWMIPLGLIVLSIDLPWARRGRRRLSVWFHRRYPVLASKISPHKSQTNLREGGDSS